MDTTNEQEEYEKLCETWQSIAKNASLKFVKGFTSGVVLYAGVKGITALVRNPFRKRIPNFLKETTDCLRFAGFLGLYPSVYDLLLKTLQTKRQTKDGWNNCIAGGIAGLTILVEEPTRRRVICLFAIARAFGALVSTLVVREKIPVVPYSETMLFCLCCAFLVYCTALKPQLLFKGYYYSVLKWSRDYTDEKLDTLFRKPGDTFLTCNEVGLHPDSCTNHAMKDFVYSVPAFAKLYLPIHVAPVLIFRRKLLLQRPKRVIRSLAKNVFFSTAFLASMVMLAKYVICLLRNVKGNPPPLSGYIPAIAGIAAGLGVLFEKASRRKELSLFLIPHSLYALYLWAKEHKLVKHIPYSSVGLFAISMVSVMHAYEREPDSLSMLLKGVLRYFIGKQTNPVQRPKRIRQFSELLS